MLGFLVNYINEGQLAFLMEKGPSHIAIILDGNRRYATKHKLELYKGHEIGAKKVEQLLDWCYELGVKELTLYSFSTENFNRNKREVGFLMGLFRKQLEKLKNDKRLDKDKIKVVFIGRLGLFPKDIQEEMKEIMENTKAHDNLKVNFAMGYGSKQEIVDAVNKLLKKGVKEVDEKDFENELYLKSKPDLLIRPGGELRVSNFLLWQCCYSELIFLRRLWPEFTKKDLIKCIEEYKRRKRRFGR